MEEWWQSSRLQDYVQPICQWFVAIVASLCLCKYLWGRYLEKWVSTVEVQMNELKAKRLELARAQEEESNRKEQSSINKILNKLYSAIPQKNSSIKKSKLKVFQWEGNLQSSPKHNNTSRIKMSQFNWENNQVKKVNTKKSELINPLKSMARIQNDCVRVTFQNPNKTIGLGHFAEFQQQRIKDQERKRERQQQQRIRLERDRQIAIQKQKKEREDAARAAKIAQDKAIADQIKRRQQQQKQNEAQRQRLIKIKQDQLKRLQDIQEKKIQEQKAAEAAERQKQAQLEAQKAAQLAQQQKRLGQVQRLIKKAAECPNEQLLEAYIKYADTIKESQPIQTAMNSVGDVRKNIKDIFSLTDSLLDSFNTKDPEQMNTFMVKVWHMIVMTQFKSAKKDGFEETPPTSEEVEIYKNMINGFALMVNLMRVRGHERLWVYMVGKTLGLVDFIYKRKEPLANYEQLDLIRKNYLSFRANVEKVYTSRLDQITYFLFALTALDPYSSFLEIIERKGGADRQTMQLVNAIQNIPWNYSIFWVLVECVRKTPFRYFKPICYSNIFSMLYLKYRDALKTGAIDKNPFVVLYQQLLKESADFQKIIDRDPQIRMLMDIDEPDKFNGDDFFDTIEPMTKNMYRTKKRILGIKNYKEFEKEASPLYYFKPMEVNFM